MKTETKWTAILLAACSASVAAGQESELAGRTYDVQVLTAEPGGAFRDCVTFHEGGRLELAAAGDLGVIWRTEPNPVYVSSFQAVTDAADISEARYGLALYGSLVGRDTISVNAINEFGMSYILAGRENELCKIGPRQVEPGGPWRRVPATPPLYEPGVSAFAGGLFETAWQDPAAPGDCVSFTITGNLSSSVGGWMQWRHSTLDTDRRQFQAVGSVAFGNEGQGLHGLVRADGTVLLSYVDAALGKAERMFGLSEPVANCIHR